MSEIVPKKRIPLAQAAADVEAICEEIDDAEEITPELLQRFMGARADLAETADRWLYRLDAVKSRIDLLKEMKARVKKAIRVAENVQTSMKGYIKHVIETHDRVPMKGTAGTLYLHGQAESLQCAFKTEEKTVYNVVEQTADIPQSAEPYFRTVTLRTLDRAKLTADLKAGMKLPWARLEKGSHVRIRS